MILYHGTNEDISEIDLSKSRLGKDFGVGFYLTSDRNVARRQAERKFIQQGSGDVMCMNTNGMNVQIESCEYCGLMGML